MAIETRTEASEIRYKIRFIVLLWAIWGTAVRAGHTDEIPLKPQASHDVDWTVDDAGILNLTTTGRDPYVVFAIPPTLNLAATPVLEMEYFAAAKIESTEIRFGSNRWHITVPSPALPTAQGFVPWSIEIIDEGSSARKQDGFTQLRIDFGNNSNRRLQIRRLITRALTDAELKQRREREQVRNRKTKQAKLLRQRWNHREQASQLLEFHVGEQTLMLAGKSSSPEANLHLCGFDYAGDAESFSDAIVDLMISVGDQQSFYVQLPRHAVKDHDYAELRFRVFQRNADDEWQPVSNVLYPTEFSGAASILPPPSLRNAKGMGGIMSNGPHAELVELGIRHITVNMVVTGLLSESQHPGSVPFNHRGKQWWVRQNRLAGVDRIVRFATDHNITVAAIVLLPNRSSDPIGHPEATGHGIYDMPNFVDSEAVQRYSAVLKFLSKRYNGSSESEGRIDHWIMHNEVDFGWTWTNMGEQPMGLFLDHYVRSMRLMWLHAIQQNPHAKVFISLTHHWNKPKPSNWRTYGPKQLLELLAKMTKAEGDFDWGVAYHPYPQSLFHPETWKDTRVTDSFETPLITMKNIQVLKRFLQQPEFLDRRQKLRPVLFSEQGYHTDGNSQEAQRIQAAALLYTWDRLRETDFVMAYDYHRWVDHPNEGGLLLGIRSLPTPGKPFGDKKLGWSVMKAIDTDEESVLRSESGLVEIYQD